MAVTMREVATAARVSIKTVSNVVNDYPFIKPATRDRVQRAIDELGYRPNLSARNLSRGRTGLIALALPELDAPYFAEMARLVIAAAAAQSWTVLIEQTDGLRSRELMALQGVRTHLVDGVILSPLALGPAELAEAGTAPVVLLGERASVIQLDHVAIDNIAASVEAVLHMANNGRRRIAAIGAQAQVSAQTAHQRLAGYRRGLEAASLPYRAELVRPAHEWHRNSGAEATRELLRMEQPPDAIFCFNDLLALGALAGAVRGKDRRTGRHRRRRLRRHRGRPIQHAVADHRRPGQAVHRPHEHRTARHAATPLSPSPASAGSHGRTPPDHSRELVSSARRPAIDGESHRH